MFCLISFNASSRWGSLIIALSLRLPYVGAVRHDYDLNLEDAGVTDERFRRRLREALNPDQHKTDEAMAGRRSSDEDGVHGCRRNSLLARGRSPQAGHSSCSVLELDVREISPVGRSDGLGKSDPDQRDGEEAAGAPEGS